MPILVAIWWLWRSKIADQPTKPTTGAKGSPVFAVNRVYKSEKKSEKAHNQSWPPSHKNRILILKISVHCFTLNNIRKLILSPLRYEACLHFWLFQVQQDPQDILCFLGWYNNPLACSVGVLVLELAALQISPA